MAVTTIENIVFKSFPNPNTYKCFAKHGELPAGVIEAVFDQSGMRNNSIVMLDKIQITPDYRKIGIATTLIDGLITWSKDVHATSIAGYIMDSLLLRDTPEHFARFFQTHGFTVEGNDFWMKI